MDPFIVNNDGFNITSCMKESGWLCKFNNISDSMRSVKRRRCHLVELISPLSTSPAERSSSSAVVTAKREFFEKMKSMISRLRSGALFDLWNLADAVTMLLLLKVTLCWLGDMSRLRISSFITIPVLIRLICRNAAVCQSTRVQ